MGCLPQIGVQPTTILQARENIRGDDIVRIDYLLSAALDLAAGSLLPGDNVQASFDNTVNVGAFRIGCLNRGKLATKNLRVIRRYAIRVPVQEII